MKKYGILVTCLLLCLTANFSFGDLMLDACETPENFVKVGGSAWRIDDVITPVVDDAVRFRTMSAYYGAYYSTWRNTTIPTDLSGNDTMQLYVNVIDPKHSITYLSLEGDISATETGAAGFKVLGLQNNPGWHLISFNFSTGAGTIDGVASADVVWETGETYTPAEMSYLFSHVDSLYLQSTHGWTYSSTGGFGLDEIKMVPEPATMSLIGVGLIGFLSKKRR